MSSPDRETVSSITTDRSVAQELEANRGENKSVLGYINRVYSAMRHERSYGPVLNAFNRIGNATIGIALGDPRDVHAPAFVMGQVLGLEAMQLAGGEDVKDKVYQGLNVSYAQAQLTTNRVMKVEVKRREKPELELSFLRPGYIAKALRQEFVDQDVESKVFDEEIALVTMWALELAPNNPMQQQQLIDGYIFVRYRSGEILVKPADLTEMRETFDGIVESSQGDEVEIVEIPLDSFKEKYLATFKARREALGTVDMADEAKLNATLDVLSRVIKEEFEAQSDVELFDRIEVKGPAIVMYRMTPSSKFTFLPLRDDQRLQAIIKDIDVGVVAKEDIARQVIESNKANKTFKSEPNDHLITPLLNMTEAAVIRDDGVVKPFRADVALYIPMEYETNHLTKLAKTTEE